MNENYIRELIRQELANLGDSMRPGAANALRGLDPDYETGRVRLEAQVSSTRHDDQMRAPVHKGEIVPFEFHFSVQLDQPGAITGVVVEAPSPVSGSFQIDGGDPHPVDDFNTVVGRLKGGNHVIKGVVETGGLGYVQLGWDTAGNGTPTPSASGDGTFAQSASAAPSLYSINFYADNKVSQMDTDGVTTQDVDLATLISDWVAVSCVNGSKGIWISRLDGSIFLTYQKAGSIHKVAKCSSDLTSVTFTFEILGLSGLTNTQANPQYSISEGANGAILVCGTFDTPGTTVSLLRFAADGASYLGRTDFGSSAGVGYVAAAPTGTDAYVAISNGGADSGIYMSSTTGGNTNFVALPNLVALDCDDVGHAWVLANYSTGLIREYDNSLSVISNFTDALLGALNDLTVWDGLAYFLLFSDSTFVQGIRRYTTAGVFQAEWHQSVAVNNVDGIAVTPA